MQIIQKKTKSLNNWTYKIRTLRDTNKNIKTYATNTSCEADDLEVHSLQYTDMYAAQIDLCVPSGIRNMYIWTIGVAKV